MEMDWRTTAVPMPLRMILPEAAELPAIEVCCAQANEAQKISRAQTLLRIAVVIDPVGGCRREGSGRGAVIPIEKIASDGRGFVDHSRQRIPGSGSSIREHVGADGFIGSVVRGKCESDAS